MPESNLNGDYVSLALIMSTGILGLILACTVIGLLVAKMSFDVRYFRLLCLTWLCLLGSSSVWSFSKDVRFSLDQAGTDSMVRFAFLAAGLMLLFFINYLSGFVSLSELFSAPIALFTVFGLWGIGTTLWSVSPAGTMYKSVEYLAMLSLFALSASLIRTSVTGWEARWEALKKLFDFAWITVFGLLVSVYVGVILWPEIGIQRSYRDESGTVGFSIQGVLPGIAENSVGQLGMLLALICVVRLVMGAGSYKFYVPLMLFSVATAVMTQSRTPVLAFAVALVVVLVASRRFGLLLASAFGGLVVLLSSYGLVFFEFMRRGQTSSELASLTGRVGYWQASIEAIAEQPLAGHGANVGARFALQAAFGNDNISTAHNTVIEVLLDTGIIGLAIFLVAVVVMVLRLFGLRSVASESSVGRLLWVESLGVMTLYFVRSLFSVNLVWSWNVIFFGVVMVFICVGSHQRVRDKKPKTEGTPAPQLLSAAGGRGSGISR